MQPPINETVHISEGSNEYEKRMIIGYKRYLYLWFNRGLVTNIQKTPKPNQCSNFDNILLCYSDTDSPKAFHIISSINPTHYIYLGFDSFKHAKKYLNDKDFLWAVLWQRHKGVCDSGELTWLFKQNCQINIDDDVLTIDHIINFEVVSRARIINSGVFFAVHKYDTPTKAKYTKIGFEKLNVEGHEFLEVMADGAITKKHEVRPMNIDVYHKSPFADNIELTEKEINRLIGKYYK